jgi:hypothetical protein
VTPNSCVASTWLAASDSAAPITMREHRQESEPCSSGTPLSPILVRRRPCKRKWGIRRPQQAGVTPLIERRTRGITKICRNIRTLRATLLGYASPCILCSSRRQGWTPALAFGMLGSRQWDLTQQVAPNSSRNASSAWDPVDGSRKSV